MKYLLLVICLLFVGCAEKVIEGIYIGDSLILTEGENAGLQFQLERVNVEEVRVLQENTQVVRDIGYQIYENHYGLYINKDYLKKSKPKRIKLSREAEDVIARGDILHPVYDDISLETHKYFTSGKYTKMTEDKTWLNWSWRYLFLLLLMLLMTLCVILLIAEYIEKINKQKSKQHNKIIDEWRNL